jgi:hypothetical protein
LLNRNSSIFANKKSIFSQIIRDTKLISNFKSIKKMNDLMPNMDYKILAGKLLKFFRHLQDLGSIRWPRNEVILEAGKLFADLMDGLMDGCGAGDLAVPDDVVEAVGSRETAESGKSLL